jgi:hypothetical protein
MLNVENSISRIRSYSLQVTLFNADHITADFDRELFRCFYLQQLMVLLPSRSETLSRWKLESRGVVMMMPSVQCTGPSEYPSVTDLTCSMLHLFLLLTHLTLLVDDEYATGRTRSSSGRIAGHSGIQTRRGSLCDLDGG